MFSKISYLHQGKVFQLTPTPEVEAVGGGFSPFLCERFWLCAKCCKEMTLGWGGNEPKLVPLHAKPVVPILPVPVNVQKKAFEQDAPHQQDLGGDEFALSAAEWRVIGWRKQPRIRTFSYGDTAASLAVNRRI